MNYSEKTFIKILIGEYREIHSNLSRLENDLKMLEIDLKVEDSPKLSDLKFNIVSEVEKLQSYRETELNFWNQIKEKYGPGSFDPVSME